MVNYKLYFLSLLNIVVVERGDGRKYANFVHVQLLLETIVIVYIYYMYILTCSSIQTWNNCEESSFLLHIHVPVPAYWKLTIHHFHIFYSLVQVLQDDTSSVSLSKGETKYAEVNHTLLCRM